MDEGLSRLVKLAWKTVPALEANTAIARARRATLAGEEAARSGAADLPEADDDDGPMARSYELVFDATATFVRFTAEQLPRLVYHLESVGAHLPQAGGVLICIFEGANLHFLQARELIAEVCRQLEVPPEELVRLYGTGESRTAQRGPTLALPEN